jgi:hypothetical protein
MHAGTGSAKGWLPTKLECSYPALLSKVRFTENRIRMVPVEFWHRVINALWSSELLYVKVLCKIIEAARDVLFDCMEQISS